MAYEYSDSDEDDNQQQISSNIQQGMKQMGISQPPILDQTYEYSDSSDDDQNQPPNNDNQNVRAQRRSPPPSKPQNIQQHNYEYSSSSDDDNQPNQYQQPRRNQTTMQPPPNRHSYGTTPQHSHMNDQNAFRPQQNEKMDFSKYPKLFHHRFLSNPFNQWDPNNLKNDPRAASIVNKPGGIGLESNRPQIKNNMRNQDADRSEYLARNREQFHSLDHVSIDGDELKRHWKPDRGRGRGRGMRRGRGRGWRMGRGRGGRGMRGGFRSGPRGGGYHSQRNRGWYGGGQDRGRGRGY